MNIKKALLVTLSTSLIATTLLHTNYVNAEETKVESKATVEFEDNTSIPELLNPEDPYEPLNPDEVVEAEDKGKVTNQNGPLSLDYVSNIDFGNIGEVNIEGGIYEAVINSNDAPKIPYIQVTDQRGPGNGWHVLASASPFEDGHDNKTLPGATIKFQGGVAESPNGFKEPTVDDVILNTEEDEVRMAWSNGADLNDAEGLGSWIIKWFEINEDTNKNKNIQLDVPRASATEGKHKTTITWTLSDGPGN